MNERFERSLKSGEHGEMVAEHLLMKEENIKTVVNVTRDKRMQAEDVDLLFKNKKGQLYKVEVKSDWQCGGEEGIYTDPITGKQSKVGTHNILYEVTTSGNKGCLAKTKADYIMYYNRADKEMYLMNTITLREYIEKEKNNLKEVRCGDNATGYTLKIKNLINKKVISKVWSDCE